MQNDRKVALGMMSGTSMDAIDLAIIETDGEVVFRTAQAAAYPYPSGVRARLGEVIGRDPSDVPDLSALAHAVTDAHADAAADFLDRCGLASSDVDIVGFHGQTIFHDPDRGMTCQLGDGQRLANSLRIPVVNDFRSADVAAGGEGAPLAPLYHAALCAHMEKPVCVLNLGGVANLTWIGDQGGIIAFDTGPANALVDDWVAQHTNQSMDIDGDIARRGVVNDAALSTLMQNSFFARPYPKSLDRDHFDPAAVKGLSVEDGASTLVAFTAEAVLSAEKQLPSRPLVWLVTGGGRHNRVMMSALRQRLSGSVDPVERVGWQGDFLEAQAFGYLAVRTLRELPLSLPSTTGVPEPMRGGVQHLPNA